MNKKSILLFGLTLLIIGSIYAFTIEKSTKKTVDNTKINWYTLEEAIKLNKKDKKKFVLDIYTNWCHWCKVMDKETFTDPAVIQYINEHFYAVKFDAESKENISFQGKDFKFVNAGRRGVNTLAYFLLDGRLSYPTLVYLDEDLNKIKKSPGFKKPNQMVEELKIVETASVSVEGS